jgi:hypothetical protein
MAIDLTGGTSPLLAISASVTAFMLYKIIRLSKAEPRAFPDGLPFKHALMSHRGGSREFVENTIPAFRNSVAKNFDLLGNI